MAYNKIVVHDRVLDIIVKIFICTSLPAVSYATYQVAYVKVYAIIYETTYMHSIIITMVIVRVLLMWMDKVWLNRVDIIDTMVEW